ncbi:TM2 domain-containing membrane protein YozV [Dysgonomonas sp. PH5-45]|uniref:NINE protein n=1 Tax=unclassified Dysgonomonas TaxID=2630389 RepID=UPI00247719AF|nr:MULTISPECIES: NINE protein [unclassified Dysgonomonas]MDH6354827.1 TM2 domain-containing membrane protein YozV [Dysgonomonas sp. PH5-45]MDH6387726.1 TM2 domain-containing membrane protein YozV [Dysgonomonas sp. PH5-37]
MKSKTTAAVLAILLGGIGVHRFYLNQTGLGILYFLFCWTFIPLIVSVIDFIGFLIMDENKFNQKYNTTYPLYPNHTNITVNNGSLQNDSVKSNSSSDEIEKLFDLKEKGIITQEEFEFKKKTLL